MRKINELICRHDEEVKGMGNVEFVVKYVIFPMILGFAFGQFLYWVINS